MNVLAVQLFGPPSIKINEHPVKLPRARTEGVFYYCLAAGKPVPDGELLDLFWPGQGQNAAQRVSEAISQINTTMGSSLREAGASNSPPVCIRDLRQRTVMFTWPAGLDYDVAHFENLVKTVGDAGTEAQAVDALERASALYQRGPFLGNFHVRDAGPSFDDWVTTMHTTLEGHYLKLLQPLGMHYIARGTWATATEYLQKLQQGTPEAEVVYGLLMVCYASIGNMAQVEKTYHQYVQMMDEVLRSAPNGALTELHQIIRAGHLVPLQVKTFVERALQIKRHLMHVPLQVALQAALKATGVKKVPTPSARYHQVLHGAQEEARRHGDSFVGTPHLFLALCTTDPDPLHDILNHMGVRLDSIVQRVRFILGDTSSESQAPPTEQTLSLQRLCRTAQELAEDIGTDTTDILHLWMALLKEERSLLNQVLMRCGVKYALVLKEMEQEIAEAF